MKCEKLDLAAQSAFHGQFNVSFSIEPHEAQELRQDLALIHNYEEASIKAIVGHCFDGIKFPSPKESDWYKSEFAVKNDKFIVSVHDGACG